jgi:hypothetical protein
VTHAELRQYLHGLTEHYPLDELYVPRRFTALAETGSLSDDLQVRSLGILRDREPILEEILTHPAISIVSDPGGGKSVVARAAIHKIIGRGERVPIFGEIKQYRRDLSTLFHITTPAAILNPEETIEGAPVKRTYVLDGIDEIPGELLERFGAELREFMAREPRSYFICTARQAFFVANRSFLPPVPAVFHILPFADDDVQQYITNARIDTDLFMKSIWDVNASEEIRNPFVLSVMVERFRTAGALGKVRSENLSYMIDRLLQSRPQISAHRQRRALRMLAVAMETYSRNELTEQEALRVVREAMRISEQESLELLNELYGSILKRTGNGLGFQLASYGEYLAAEDLEDEPLQRVKELAFLDFSTPNESWLNAISYLLEVNPDVRKAFVRQHPFWTLSASPAAFSEHERDIITNDILKEVTETDQLVCDHPRIPLRRLSDLITSVTESVLQKDLASQNDVVLGNALALLGIRGRRDVVPLAMEVLADRKRSSGLRVSAILALVNSGGIALIPTLIDLLDPADSLHINIVDLIGALADETQMETVLPILLRTNAGLSAAYSHFRELKSRAALIAVLQYFLTHPGDLNSLRVEGYVEPILKLIPRYWDADVRRLIVDLLDLIERQHIYPDPSGIIRKLFEIVGAADPDGSVPRWYFAKLIKEGRESRRRLHSVDQILAGLMRPTTAQWLIEINATALIQQLAPYLHGEVREILRIHSNGIIDEQDSNARRYREEQAEAEKLRKTAIETVQDRLRNRRSLREALADFEELGEEHWPELPETFLNWLSGEISLQLQKLDLERSIQWKQNSLWEPGILPLLLGIIDRYSIRIDPDEPLVFAAMSIDRDAAANHYRRFGLSDTGRRTLDRLLYNPSSTKALEELVRFIQTSDIWSDEIANALRSIVTDRADKGDAQIMALHLLAKRGADDDLISRVDRDGATEDLRKAAFETLIERQHRPTIERSLALLASNDQELKHGEVPMFSHSPLDWIAKIRSNFALPKLIELREEALRLELSGMTQLISNTIGKIDRSELVRVIRRQMNVVPEKWRRWQQLQVLEQERQARIEESQRTPFDEVLKKLKGATSLNRLVVMCEGATDIAVYDELVGQCEEVPEIVFGDVGGWSGLRNKDPNFLLLSGKEVMVVMDGDEGRKLSKKNQPLTDMAREQHARLAKYGIELRVLRRYGIENYFPKAAVQRVLGIDLSDFFPVPEDQSFVGCLSRDSKGLFYRFRRWVASKLNLKMPPPRQPLYSKNHNEAVAKLISLNSDLAGTDLFEIIRSIADRARALQQE